MQLVTIHSHYKVNIKTYNVYEQHEQRAAWYDKIWHYCSQIVYLKKGDTFYLNVRITTLKEHRLRLFDGMSDLYNK